MRYIEEIDTGDIGDDLIGGLDNLFDYDKVSQLIEDYTNKVKVETIKEMIDAVNKYEDGKEVIDKKRFTDFITYYYDLNDCENN